MPTNDYGGTVLMCAPSGDKNRIQVAHVLCLRYEREAGADELSEVAG